MNTITIPRETVEQALKEFKEIIDWPRIKKVPLRQQELRSINSRIEELSAALQQDEPLERLTRLTEEMGLYPWQEKSEPQAQAGHLHLKPPFEDENGNDISGWYITLQAHREAMAERRRQEVVRYERNTQFWAEETAKKDAALKACVDARDRLAQEPTVLIQKWKVLQEFDAVITKAQEAMK